MNSTLATAIPYRKDIDGLRAIAVITVIFYHLQPGYLPSGFIGVDMFFVISGFIITRLILQQKHTGTFSLLDFYQRRMRRLAPALLLVLAFVFFYGRQHLFPNEFHELSLQLAAGSGFFMNFVLLQQVDYFDNSALSKPLMHLWSLGIEEQFYLSWPLMLLLITRSRHATYFCAMLLIASFASYYYISSDSRSAAFYLPHTRAWELLIGAALAISQKQFSLQTSRIISPLGLILLLFSFAVITPQNSASRMLLLLPCFATALLIACHPQNFCSRYLLSNKPAVAIGTISYALYLWHWPLISFSYLKLGDNYTDWSNSIQICAMTLLLAIISYFLVERPIRRSTHPLTAAALFIGLLLLIGISYSHWRSPWLSSPTSEFVTTNDGYSKYYVRLRRDHQFIPDLMQQRNQMIRHNYCNYRHIEPNQLDHYDFSKDNCLQLSDTKPNVLVLGDSYADDTFAALNAAYPEVNFLQLTGCSFKYAPDDTCNNHLRYALKLATNPSLKAIVVSNLWRSDLEQAESFIKSLIATGKPVTVIGSGPEFSFYAYLIAGDRGRSQSPNEAVAAFIIQETIAVNQQVENHFSQVGASFFNRLDVFCPSTTPLDCPLVNDNGEPFIWDSGHLFPAGMLKLGEAMREQQLLPFH